MTYLFNRTARGAGRPDISRGCMISFARIFKQTSLAAILLVAAISNSSPARADDEFPFGMEMTLDVTAQPGSKRRPNLEIGDSGEVVLELWCMGGKAEFSVAG